MLGIIPHFIYQAKMARKAQIAALPPDLQGIARHADKLYERALRIDINRPTPATTNTEKARAAQGRTRENKMSAQSPVRADHPMMVAWNEFKATEEFANAERWAHSPEHLDGSLWAVFIKGWYKAVERAADLHPDIDNASDAERQENIPGAGAMGAVIDYRDKIRTLIGA